MLRTLLVGILAVSGACKNGGGGDAPVAQPGATAGKVVELTGKVTATRGADVRTLSAGSEISADDVIDTGADGRVAILLAHNNARWDLGPNKHGKVGESLAWTAAKQDRPAKAVDEETSTAGRYAEKTAATTASTTATESARAPSVSEEGGEAVRRKEAVRAPGAAAPPPSAAAPSEPAPAAAPSPPPPPPPPPARPDKESAKAPRATKAPTAAAPRDDRRAVDPGAFNSDDEGIGLGIRGTGQGGGGGGTGGGTIGGVGRGGGDKDVAPRAPGATIGSSDSGPPSLESEIRTTVVKERTALTACLSESTPRLLVTITVTKGKYAIETSDPAANDVVRACLGKIAKRLKATSAADPIVVKVNLVRR